MPCIFSVILFLHLPRKQSLKMHKQTDYFCHEFTRISATISASVSAHSNFLISSIFFDIFTASFIASNFSTKNIFLIRSKSFKPSTPYFNSKPIPRAPFSPSILPFSKLYFNLKTLYNLTLKSLSWFQTHTFIIIIFKKIYINQLIYRVNKI